MAMNRKTIRDLVIETTGRSDKEALINSAINIALNKVSSAHLWNDLLTEASVTLTVNAVSVALASDVRRLSEVRLIDGRSSYSIAIRPKTWLVQQYPSFTDVSSTTPRFGYLQGTTLHYVPASDTADTVTYSYYKLHPDLLDDTTLTLILQADEAIIAYTTHWVFKATEQHENADRWLESYAIELNNAKRADRSSAVKFMPTPRNQGFRPTDEYWRNPFIRSAGSSGWYNG